MISISISLLTHKSVFFRIVFKLALYHISAMKTQADPERDLL